jgi:AcrR family transcriptional regulator
MSGRRERKKNAVRTAVVDAAAAMFAREGFDSTRVESIAHAADVAVGTVYNYFPAKSDILLAVLVRDAQDAIEAAAAHESAYGLAATIVDVMERRPRHLWRQLYAQALMDEERMRPAFTYVLAQFEGFLGKLLPPEHAALAMSIGFSAIFRYVLDDDVTEAHAKAAVLEQLRGAGVERA